jgi:hypothetical protein
VNGIIKEFLDLLQVEHEKSLAYSKEQNAIVERANREVMRHLPPPSSISESMTYGLRISSGMQPIEVAARNAGEFFVERIIDHNGLVRNRKDMTFLVRWKGYTEKNDTWESYNNVRLTQAFVNYCTEKKMRSLVSKKLKSSNEL